MLKGKTISTFILCSLLLSDCLIMSGCGNQGGGTAETASETSSVSVTEASAKEGEPEDIVTENEEVVVPEINVAFTDEFHGAKNRGKAVASLCDDDKAEDGKALKIYHRIESWNGADFDGELFRGNTVDVGGSFRSSCPSVRVSLQYTVNGSTSYNSIFTVNTSEDSYTQGNGSFVIPANAEKIVFYIESDNLDDIYCDSFSVKVSGEYTYLSEAAEIVFTDTSAYPSLKELYKDDFLIGIAATSDMLDTEEYCTLIKAQFNSFTLGNNFKPDSLLDRSKTLSDIENYMECPAIKFDNVKKELDFAKENGMTVRGHTLVWHSQTPDWIFYKDYDVKGELADRELMLKRMENYISTVMTWTEENYPGLVSVWDVVNEAADDGGGMRKSLWYQTIGEDYVQKAFEYARQYAPEGTKLFYNDYNSYQTRKQKDIIDMLTPIVADGNIDGMGMQSHINTDISVSLYAAAMKRYAEELGLEIQVTELDVGAKLNDGWKDVQGEYYRKLMSELLKAKRNGVPLTSVTIWGLTDSLSWKASEFSLIFEDDLSRKPAFDGMVQAVEDVAEVRE